MNDLVYIVSAPSGVGKTTLNRMLVAKYPDKVEVSVSLTDRDPRPGEKPGQDYFFVSTSEFKQHVDRQEMLEWAKVHGHYYGTSLKQIEEIQKRHHIPILEIDVQGFLNARQRLNNVQSIFILPPSIKDLWHRLEMRGTDSLQERWKRLQNAKKEIEKAHLYDHIIINDQIEKAFKKLEDIIIYQKSLDPEDRLRAEKTLRNLLDEFESAEWIRQLAMEHNLPVLN